MRPSRSFDQIQALRPASALDPVKDPLAGGIEPEADMIHAGIQKLPHLDHVAGQDGHIERQIGDGPYGPHDAQRLLEGILGYGHLEAGTADGTPRHGFRQPVQHLAQLELGPGHAREMQRAGLALPGLGAERAIHQAPTAEHQVGSGRRDRHGRVQQAQKGRSA